MRRITKADVEAEVWTRRGVADYLKVHPDTVSRLMAEGLASAVLVFGGHSKPMTFSAVLVRRWQLARLCNSKCSACGRGCGRCSAAMDDARAMAAHFLEFKHGVLDEHDTDNPDEGCFGWEVDLPPACREAACFGEAG